MCTAPFQGSMSVCFKVLIIYKAPLEGSNKVLILHGGRGSLEGLYQGPFQCSLNIFFCLLDYVQGTLELMFVHSTWDCPI